MGRKFIHQKNKIEISFDIILEEPLHIGVNKSETSGDINLKENANPNDKEENKSLVKLLKIRDTNEPFIPGSSIRGVFRDKYLEILENNNDVDFYNDDLFGYIKEKESKRGRIIIEDSYLKDFDEKMIQEINAYTKMVEHNIVIKIECVSTKNRFKSNLILYNVDYLELFRILQIFSSSYYDEIRIGSNKSRGFGRVRLHIEDIILEKNDNELLSDEIEKYFDIDDERSIKVSNNKYLMKKFRLKKEYKNFDFSDLEKVISNEFLLHIEERGSI